MGGNSVGINILWWSETIIALRVLLFSLPVIINKSLAKTFVVSNINDRFIAVLTVAALFYCVVGVSSIFGHRYWKSVHLLAAIFTGVLTLGSIYILEQPATKIGVYYFTPIIFSVVIALIAGVLGGAKKAA